MLLFVLLGCTAQGCGSAVPRFDGDRAFAALEKQVSFGPRVPGTPAHDACRDYILAELSALADRVEEQKFTGPLLGKRVPMTNIIARFNPASARKVILCAHWDSRPFSDQELTEEKRKLPVPGANDGASGVAVLLELARSFHLRKPPVQVVMVLFDGEDSGRSSEGMYLGSRHFARKIGEERFEGAILLDMVGDKDLNLYREQNSDNHASALVDRIWRTAADMGYGRMFINRQKYAIEDDHLPLIAAGIAAVDVIDFDYAWWHTTEDTPDKCSPRSLKAVGDVIQRVIYGW